jgi:hypothetical protein
LGAVKKKQRPSALLFPRTKQQAQAAGDTSTAVAGIFIYAPRQIRMEPTIFNYALFEQRWL